MRLDCAAGTWGTWGAMMLPGIRRLLRRRKRPRGAVRLREGRPRSLYEMPDGSRMWLCPGIYVDDCLIREGVFEADSASVVRRLVKPGNVCCDVGANIGYFTVLLARRAGASGRVHAFEPTRFYGEPLARNVAENGLSNVTIHTVGLSDQEMHSEIAIGESSATLHWPLEDAVPRGRETIHLVALDDYVPELGLERLDFVKMDVDGHEPFVLRGARATIRKYRPTIMLEVSHLNYYHAGVFAWDFYDELIREGFRIHREKDLQPLPNKDRFLIECGNFSRSANIVISLDELPKPA